MAVKKEKVIRDESPAALPEGWQIVRFDQIADHITDRVDNPSEAGVERYVGLEHIDPESLKIRRWGSPDDVEATKLRFKPGDIIFGKRRAYQRKLAVADFEGICSAHAMVLRAREDTVIKGFLPFFMQSDIFFDRALAISVGSLSPTINWKTLASQQFAIPLKDEQRRIAEILLATDELIEKREAITDDLRILLATQLNHLLTRGIGFSHFKSLAIGERPKHWHFGTVGDFLELQRGFDITEKAAIAGKVPVVSSSGISYFNKTAMAQPPGVVTGRKGKLGDVFFLDVPYWPHDTSLWVKDFKGNDARFIFWLLKFLRLDKLDAATAVPTLNRNNVHPLEVAVPPLAEQKAVAHLLDSIVRAIDIAEMESENLKIVKRALIATMMKSRD